SYAERQNLNMRMGMRRFTRLTNAFSNKCENHGHMIGLYYAFYNFCRVHQTLKTTPAVVAGVADHVWTLTELVGLLDWAEARATLKCSISPTTGRALHNQPTQGLPNCSFTRSIMTPEGTPGRTRGSLLCNS